MIILDWDTDVSPVANFEIDVFGDDWVVAIADDEKLRRTRHASHLVGLTCLDKTS